MNTPNWPELISELAETMTFTEIAEAVGLASSGHVSNIKSGQQKTVSYEVGCKLKDLHHRVMRKRRRAAAL